MRDLLLKKAKARLKPDEEQEFLKFCQKQTKLIRDEFSLTEMVKIMEVDNVQISPMQHSSELSSILGQLLVKTDEIKIIINEDIIKKISLEHEINFEVISELIILHEFLHYYSYKNKIQLEYKPKGILKRKVRESEEIIINDLVDYYLNFETSIYTIYKYI